MCHPGLNIRHPGVFLSRNPVVLPDTGIHARSHTINTWITEYIHVLRIMFSNSPFWPTFGRSNLLPANLVSCSNSIRLNLVPIYALGNDGNLYESGKSPKLSAVFFYIQLYFLADMAFPAKTGKQAPSALTEINYS
jgi:hypothetical protein